ncbi:hypothetical protein QWI17_20695 [Gilvimarinus sp. SDUM040013]|uniref:Uncharacterized protein n=1 Tax=Gilvimarinus gilvus TaxID=3058038 RepID=A0ABU4RSG6_9GAMM|nr:hypothetical protein [Gilvimarinus sp. SDUM040013]MDO3388277.1 hypothetical protein [Gilvimarinus sp. SDUM040013]MDX6847827.1 hypothetical protein [Gilvimarinus sp. SDUM040013]
MDRDKRCGQAAVPANAAVFLNDLQVLALSHMECFGWQLMFIRRPLFQDPIAVVVDDQGTKVGVLESDGQVNLEPNIQLRH